MKKILNGRALLAILGANGPRPDPVYNSFGKNGTKPEQSDPETLVKSHCSRLTRDRGEHVNVQRR